MDANTLNLIFGIIGTIGTILGIVGIVLTVKSVKIKEPAYSIKSNNVISDYASKYKNLTISYKKKRVEIFTVSKVIFFNRGAETLNRDDIAALNPLRIVSINGKILDAAVLQVNNLSSDFRVRLDTTKAGIIIDFEYLNQNQGAVIEVTHTGLSSDDIDLVGDMKEVKTLTEISPNRLRIRQPLYSRRSLSTLAVAILSLLGLIGVATSAANISSLVDLFNETSSQPSSFNKNVGLGIFLLVCGWFLVSTVIYFRDAILNAPIVIPRGLERFDE